MACSYRLVYSSCAFLIVEQRTRFDAGMRWSTLLKQLSQPECVLDYNSVKYASMAQPAENRKGSSPAGIIGVIAVVIFTVMGGFEGIDRIIQFHTSHEKLTTMRYRGEWSSGEYRECQSINLKAEDKQPELDCAGFVPPSTEKVFKVSFSGDLTYDSERKESVTHHWLCRRIDEDASFSCSGKETPEEKQAAEQQQAEPTPVINDEGLPEPIKSCISRFSNPYSGAEYKTYHDDLKADCERNPQRTTP